MVGKLEGKVAIITGGGHGFGLGIVRKFVKEGAKVVIFDINAEQGKKAAAENPGAKFAQGDVSVKKDWEKALQTALQEFGKLDIVVNNAGILIVKVCWALNVLTW
jgi:NAD(P)-dependent dehydrogenase (short-subunit alcohol dehydrogenase family)